MAIDEKYGRVTLEHGTIDDDEPVIVFRAQDKLLPDLLLSYMEMCEDAGSPDRHIALVAGARDTIMRWQFSHEIKTPDSESSREWMD